MVNRPLLQQTIVFSAIAIMAIVLPQKLLAYTCADILSNGQVLYYNLIEGEAEVTYPGSVAYYGWSGYTKPSGVLIIPDSIRYNGISYPVTTINAYAFIDCTDITSVSIGNGITTIGNSAFAGCSGISSVNIGVSVVALGVSSFANCSSLSHIVIENASIGSCAFSGCNNLTSIFIGNGVGQIGQGAFSNCSSLTSIIVSSGNTIYDSRNNCNAIIETSTNNLVTGCMNTIIPATVTSIGYQAFCGCYGLSSINIPNSVTSIAESAFASCGGLNSVIIGAGVTSIGIHAFEFCGNLTSVTIPDGVTSIGDYTFFNCYGMTSVTIGSSVATIGNYAFYDCSSLTSVYCKSNVPPVLSGYSFPFNSPYYNSLYTIYVPCGSVNTYQNNVAWHYYSSNILGTPYAGYEVAGYSNSDTMGTVSIGMMDCDSIVTFIATPAICYHFVGWSNGLTDETITITVISDTTLIAVFERNEPVVGGETQIVEGGYTWHGETYTESGSYVWNGTTIEGCDSIAILDLTITHTEGVREMRDTDIPVRIYCQDGFIIVDNLVREDFRVCVYNTKGLIVDEWNSHPGQTRSTALLEGAYFVKIGSYTTRRVVVIR